MGNKRVWREAETNGDETTEIMDVPDGFVVKVTVWNLLSGYKRAVSVSTTLVPCKKASCIADETKPINIAGADYYHRP